MTHYKIKADVVGIPGEKRQAAAAPAPMIMDTPTYHNRGEVVDITDDAVAERLLRLDVIEPAKGESTTSESGGGGEEPRLTEKQALVQEAESLGLDSSGTSADLKARIEQHKAEQTEA